MYTHNCYVSFLDILSERVQLKYSQIKQNQ